MNTLYAISISFDLITLSLSLCFLLCLCVCSSFGRGVIRLPSFFFSSNISPSWKHLISQLLFQWIIVERLCHLSNQLTSDQIFGKMTSPHWNALAQLNELLLFRPMILHYSLMKSTETRNHSTPFGLWCIAGMEIKLMRTHCCISEMIQLLVTLTL